MLASRPSQHLESDFRPLGNPQNDSVNPNHALAEQLGSVGDMYEAFYTGEKVERVGWAGAPLSPEGVVRRKLFSKRLHGDDSVWSREELMETLKLWAEEDGTDGWDDEAP